MNNCIIKLCNIGKKFDDIWIFQDINFEIYENDLVAITGESGKGKSTLLYILGTLLQQTTGELKIFGKLNPHYNNKLGKQLLKHDIGFIFQNYALIETKTIEENLNIARKFSNYKKSNKEVLSEVGLSDISDKKVYQLSGGEQQRVAIARLIIKDPKIILADELTGSLDKVNRDIILELLMKLHQQGKTIIIVTHDDYVKSFCKRSIEL